MIICTPVTKLLERVRPQAYCDACVAETLGMPSLGVIREAEELDSPFQRKLGRCAHCRAPQRVVTRYTGAWPMVRKGA
jgi:hypothetical protein